MGTLRNAALAAALLSLSAGVASAAGTWTDLRQDEPAFDALVATAPSSALQGRLNRVAALLDSAALRDLPAGSTDALPARFQRDMTRALDALAEEVGAILPSLGGRDALVLLVAVDRVAFRRNVELLSDAEWEYCGPDAIDCASPPVLAALDRLGFVLADAFYLVAESYRDEATANPLLPAFEVLVPEGYNSQTFSAEVDRAVSETARALGIESIDD